MGNMILSKWLLGIGSAFFVADVDDDGFGNGTNRPGLYGYPRQSKTGQVKSVRWTRRANRAKY